MRTAHRHLLLAATLLIGAIPDVAAEYRPSTEGNAFPENTYVASMCARGFAVAVHAFAQEQYKTKQRDFVIRMAKEACIEDAFVVSLYNAMKNGPDAKTFKESRVLAEEIVTNWINNNLEVLRRAEKQETNPFTRE